MNEKVRGQIRVTKTERKLQDASSRLVELRKTTEAINLEDFETVQVLCPAKDGKKELAFDKMITSNRKKFFNPDFVDKSEVLNFKRSVGKGLDVNEGWNTRLDKYVATNTKYEVNEKLKKRGKQSDKTAEAVVDKLKEKYSKPISLKLLESKFPLHGFTRSSSEYSPRLSFWEGEVDAIGWYNEKYVIIAWKMVKLENFWQELEAIKNLHECLVYAKLLEIYLNLHYLPHILIVPIERKSGLTMNPRLFTDYPQECKEILEEMEWSVEGDV